MSIPMIKHNGKMVPAKKDKDGKWVPDEGKKLVYGNEGIELKNTDDSGDV